jgi:hypothetical protein
MNIEYLVSKAEGGSPTTSHSRTRLPSDLPGLAEAGQRQLRCGRKGYHGSRLRRTAIALAIVPASAIVIGGRGAATHGGAQGSLPKTDWAPAAWSDSGRAPGVGSTVSRQR